MASTALAIVAHPDDIELMFAGTLIQLQQSGCEIHCMNLADGCMGTNRHTREEIIAIRRREAEEACRVIQAAYHPSITHDIEILYTLDLLQKVGAVIRSVEPDILLTHGPWDYMEDHIITGRLTVSAAFTRGMTNFETKPPQPILDKPVRIYHALPHMLTDPYEHPVTPQGFVDITAVMDQKKAMLACHRSQHEWLAASQGAENLIQSMEDISRQVGTLSGLYEYAEGWIRHADTGFCDPEFDPMAKVLGSCSTFPVRDPGAFP